MKNFSSQFRVFFLWLVQLSDGARASARYNVHRDAAQESPGPLPLRALKRRERRAPFAPNVCYSILRFSLTPCFSWVKCDDLSFEPFQRFFCFTQKPLKRLEIFARANTQLKQGVNEINRVFADKLKLELQPSGSPLRHLCFVILSPFGFRRSAT